MSLDLIAMGGGFAGMVTACRAAQLGLKVAVLEKESEERYRCNSRWTTGVFSVMGQPARSAMEHLVDTITKGTDGTAKPGKRVWHCSRRYVHTRQQLAELGLDWDLPSYRPAPDRDAPGR